MTTENSKKRRPSGRRYNKNKPKASGPSNRPEGLEAKKKNNSRNRRFRGPRLTPLEKIEKTYVVLLENFILARKKHYEMFYRASGQQAAKIQNNFNNTLKLLREFEENIPEELQESFNKKYNQRPVDTIYSSNHDISPDRQEVATSGNFEDPHELLSQKESDFSSDTEEGLGTIDDYYEYKGIEPPLPTSEENSEDKN